MVTQLVTPGPGPPPHKNKFDVGMAVKVVSTYTRLNTGFLVQSVSVVYCGV